MSESKPHNRPSDRSYWIADPGTDDFVLCEDIIAVVLGLVRARTPQDFSKALALVVKNGEALAEHRA